MIEDMGEEILVLDEGSGQLHRFNAMASDMLRSLVEGATSRQIVATCLDAYDAPRLVIEQDVAGFIAKLLSDNLIEPIDLD